MYNSDSSNEAGDFDASFVANGVEVDVDVGVGVDGGGVYSAFVDSDADSVPSSGWWSLPQPLSQPLSWIVNQSSRFILWDADAWMGRILVTVAIVILWDAYAYASVKRKQQQQKEQQGQYARSESSSHDDDGEKKESFATTRTTTVSSPPSNTSSKITTAAKQKPRTSTTATVTPTTTTTTTAHQTRPKIKAISNQHPGMEGFAHWYEVETSLYRIYTLAHRDPSIPTVPPYVPHSHRGNVSIELHVTNNTDRTINVFWVDYKGNYVPKGNIPRRNGVWTQTTWIDHPWVFEDADTSTPYLYYVPYRAIPTIPAAPTIGSDETIGLHKFALVSSSNNQEHPFHIGIQDVVMPYPGITQLCKPLDAIYWTLNHMSRTNVTGNNAAQTLLPDLDTLQLYLINVLKHPGCVKYRQLRIASPRFRSIWASPLRGVLLAIGFVEVGPCAELGCHDQALSSERVQEVALLSYLLNEWKREETEISTLNEQLQQQIHQPNGAIDGFGRAGFGRAGTNN